MIASKGDVRDTVDDLLLAADAMRLSGKPKKGLIYLGQIVTGHRDDPRAVLAEFTRGRILISQLGRPREAVESFRHVQKMAPNSSLAEDALAREVESWYLLGEVGHARERALLYTTRYPSGRRTQAVRQYGGLE
jgi:transmembrane sensor